MAKKRPARTGNPDLRQQKHVPTPSIEEIEKQIFSLLSPANFKPLKSYEHKKEQEAEQKKNRTRQNIDSASDDGDSSESSVSANSRIKRSN